MRLIWYQREDGLWNAACTCNATVCGVEFERRAAAEAWHFDLATSERTRRTANSVSFERHQIPDCGPKLPEPTPNLPGPLVFP